ncbi:MAG: hypothetical protein ABIW38_03170 [Ferruginibacter sp.]
MAQQKILLAHLNSNGDCLYATVIARQIKEQDYPGCHLTWAVNSRCKQTILLNPFVDEIWEIPTEKSLASKKEWDAFVKSAEAKKQAGEFDKIFYTQVIGKNMMNLNGDIRSSIYKNYPHQITQSQRPIIALSPAEVAEVKSFAQQNNLAAYKHVILFECGPDSFKSALNPGSSLAFAEKFISLHEDVLFILSSNKKTESTSYQIIDGSTISFRGNAELTKYCSFFIGCSSGISWLGTTSWAKPLQKILVINDKTILNSSMVEDHNMAGLHSGNIIEMMASSFSQQQLINCLQMSLTGQFEAAKKIYHQHYKKTNFKFLYMVAKSSFEEWNFNLPMKLYSETVRKYGFSFNALYNIIKAYVKLPFYIIKNALNR